ncbi:MAG: hypothetical protein N2B03_02860, partial [Boseongicola sp.]
KGPFRRRERAMQRFRQMRSLRKFVAVHASFCNHFSLERALYSRDDFKLNSAAALTESRGREGRDYRGDYLDCRQRPVPDLAGLTTLIDGPTLVKE